MDGRCGLAEKVIPPRSERLSQYSQAGTDVDVQLRFIKVESVKHAEGRLRVKVWMRTYWVDERLSWDPTLHGNVTQIQFHAKSLHTPEDTEVSGCVGGRCAAEIRKWWWNGGGGGGGGGGVVGGVWREEWR